MTQDTIRQALNGLGHSDHVGNDLDLLAGLWQEAPFVRLPWDAPNELRGLVEDIENPSRVYIIHKAARRHKLQVLIHKFIAQLRDGCGADFCSTPTCFTCRKRIVGRAPIRRYSPSSARTLVAYLASQDNAENKLCPGLETPKAPPASLQSLKFTLVHRSSAREEHAVHLFHGVDEAGQGAAPDRGENGVANCLAKSSPSRSGSEASGRGPRGRRKINVSSEELYVTPRVFTVTEELNSKDYRSFAANMFGTVAFKMLEWLSPSGVREMARMTCSPLTESLHGRVERAKPSANSSTQSSRSPQLAEFSVMPKPETTNTVTNLLPHPAEPNHAGNDKTENGTGETGPLQLSQSAECRPTSSQRNSGKKMRQPSDPKLKKQRSLDPGSQDKPGDDSAPVSLLHPHRRNGSLSEKTPRPLKAAGSTIPRPMSNLASAGYFDYLFLEKMPPKHVESRAKPARAQMESAKSSGSSSPREAWPHSVRPSSRPGTSQSLRDGESNHEFAADQILPQTISRLNADIVVFVCDVLTEDGTTEDHLLEPRFITDADLKLLGHTKLLKRNSQRQPFAPHVAPPDMRREWKLFIEQSLFYILSEPQMAIRSFTKKGRLYDSQTLWYCMVRLTRVTPSLVFDSLWVAAEQLFAPPKSVQSLRSPTARLFPKPKKSLSNVEAGCFMSICLHALVAAAPATSEPRQIYDISRIRSHGLSLAGSGSVAPQPDNLCLQYDDAFTNDLAIRLARRLFAAIPTRRCFDELRHSMLEKESESAEPDVLAPLLSQLDFLNMDAVYILNFSFQDRTLHEIRVPTLLLDWARAVMLHEWDGSAEVAGDGPFGGALALIETMHSRRSPLLLGDPHFRCEYFAERLDSVQMPVSWLSHTPTRQKVHLLDYPYIFNPSTLVSYFRSINFSRMSRSYEEPSSLQSRMNAISSPGSLIISSLHKRVLQDFLRTASSKFLVLDISRTNVIKDAFDQLWRREERELMRPLKVHLGEEDGEEGFDSGGVQQEFIRLAMAEALDPSYGAFTVDDRTRMIWFQPGSPLPRWKYELIGLLISLAVYNGLTLPVTFPKALYRKLLDEPVTELQHIEDGWPDLAHGLTSLAEWDEKNGPVEDVFARTYEFSVPVFGQPITREMKAASAPVVSPSRGPSQRGASSSASQVWHRSDEWPQFHQTSAMVRGNDKPNTHDNAQRIDEEPPLVTLANREAYIADYIRYLTDVSVRPQYEAFARGFGACLHPKSLTLLNSNLLQNVVEGSQEIDVSELRRYTRYVGWDASHRTVRDFWSIVKRYDEGMKKKLLEFVTASDRVPVGGAKNLQFVVQRNGGEEDDDKGHLPTAYTCYGTLLLPEYRNKEVLRERLAMALENAQGFGFA